jgi:hypothetical protein
LFSISAVRQNIPQNIPRWRAAPFTEPAKIPLIAYGNGMFSKDGVPIKGHMAGVTGILWRKLKQQEKLGQLVAIPVDEYYTSQVS